jgi:hypothetical protein
MLKREREILTCMREFERKGLDSLYQLIRSLKSVWKRQLGFW